MAELFNIGDPPAFGQGRRYPDIDEIKKLPPEDVEKKAQKVFDESFNPDPYQMPTVGQYLWQNELYDPQTKEWNFGAVLLPQNDNPDRVLSIDEVVELDKKKELVQRMRAWDERKAIIQREREAALKEAESKKIVDAAYEAVENTPMIGDYAKLGHYAMGTLKSLNEATSTWFRKLDDATVLLEDIAPDFVKEILGENNHGFAQIADAIDKNMTSGLPDTPDNVVGNMIHDVAGMTPLFVELAIMPEMSVYGHSMKLAAQMGTHGFITKYGELSKDNPDELNKIGAAFNEFGVGAMEGLALHAIGVSAGVYGKYVKSTYNKPYDLNPDLKGGLPATLTQVGFNALGFSTLTAMESIGATGYVNPREMMRSFAMGVGLGVRDISGALYTKAFKNYNRVTKPVKDRIEKSTVDPEQLRMQAIDLREKASIEEDVLEQEKLNTMADVLDNTADVKAISNIIKADPIRAKKMLSEAQNLPPEQRAALDQKITETIENTDPLIKQTKPLTTRIDEILKQEEFIANEAAFPVALKESVMAKMESEKKELQVKLDEIVNPKPVSQKEDKNVTETDATKEDKVAEVTSEPNILDKQNELKNDTENELGLSGSGTKQTTDGTKPIFGRGEKASEGMGLIQGNERQANPGDKISYLGRDYTVESSTTPGKVVIKNDRGETMEVDAEKTLISKPISQPIPLNFVMGIKDIKPDLISDAEIGLEGKYRVNKQNVELSESEQVVLAMNAKSKMGGGKTVSEAIDEAAKEMIEYRRSVPRGKSDVFADLSINQTPNGHLQTQPASSYNNAIRTNKSSKNIWVRRSKSADNSDRILMVQFSSDFLNGGRRTGDASERFYDMVYRLRKGYNRTFDFWEVPLWQAKIAGMEKNADTYVVRNINEAKAFIKSAGYKDVLFSMLDINKNHVLDISQSIPEQKFSVGGYVEFKDLKVPENVKLFNSTDAYAELNGLNPNAGFDYSNFTGTKVIPRLKLSSGCKYTCAFCTVPKDIIEVDPKIVDSQVESIADLDTKLVYLDDKTFGDAGNHIRLPEIYEKIKKTNPDFEGFIIQTTATRFNKFDNQFLQDAHIKYVELGVESYNDGILHNLRKPHNTKAIDKAVAKLRENKINYIPNIVVGFEGEKNKEHWSETEETYKNTYDHIDKNKDIISHVNVYALAIYEGTDLANSVEVKSEADRNENVLDKSFHQNPKLHRKYMDLFTKQGMDLVQQEPYKSESQTREDILKERIAENTLNLQNSFTKFIVNPSSGKKNPLTDRGNFGMIIQTAGDIAELAILKGVKDIRKHVFDEISYRFDKYGIKPEHIKEYADRIWEGVKKIVTGIPADIEQPLQDKLAGKKERKHYQTIQEDKAVGEEVKAGLRDNETARYYIPTTNAINEAEADAIIQSKGLDKTKADCMNKDNSMHPATRTILRDKVMNEYDRLGSELMANGDRKLAEEMFDNALEVAEVKIVTGTNMGQELQAYNYKNSKELSLYKVRKEVKKSRDKKLKELEGEIERLKKIARDANTEAANEAVNNPKFKDSKKKVTEPKESREPGSEPKPKKPRKAKNPADVLANRIANRVKEGKKKFDPVAEMINTLFGKVNEKLPPREPGEKITNVQKIKEAIVNKDAYADTWEESKAMVTKKIEGLDVDDAVRDRMKQDLEFYYQEIIGKPYSEKLVEGSVREEIKNLDIEIDKLVKRHYTEVDAANRSLQEKLEEDLGLTPSEAFEISGAAYDIFNRIATAKKKSLLKQALTIRERLNPARTKSLHDKIIEISNLGAFDDAAMTELFAEKYNLPKLTPEQTATIYDLADKAQRAPEGYPTQKANENLMRYYAKIPGMDWGSVGQSMWYANVLSGYNTHARNLVSNTFNTMGSFIAAGARNPSAIPWLAKGLFTGYRQGLYEAENVLRTGFSPLKEQKLEIPNVLEQWKFKGGFFNPSNYAKYVMRAMVASDAFSYSGLKEMRSHESAYREYAKANGGAFTLIKKVPPTEVWRKVNESLYGDSSRLKEVKAQVEAEGVTGTERKMRIYELMQSQRPKEMIDDAHNFAAKGTFNHATQGTLGVLTDLVSSATNAIRMEVKVPKSNKVITVTPLKFIVPFTRIIANVANTAMDYYPPVGYLRAAKGGIGYKGFDKMQISKEKYHKYTADERAEVFTKASIGLAAQVAMYIYTQPDDEGNSAIEVTANGTGDYVMNYQLRERGWIPYSIRVGDKWYSYQYTPLIFALAPLGYLRDAEKYQGKALDDKSTAERFMYVNSKLATIFSDMTFLSSVANLMTAVTDDRVGSLENYFQKLNESTLKSFVQPNLVSQVAKDVEAHFNIPVKAVKGLIPSLLKDTPIARDRYNNKVNALGEDVVPDNDIFIGEKREISREWKFINDNQCFIPAADQRANQIYDVENEVLRPMDDDEFYLFSKRRGQLIKEGWEEKPGTFTDEFGDVKELTARRISGITEISAQPNPIGDYENLMLKEHISKLVSAASAKAKHEQFAPMELISKQAKIKYDAKQKYIKEGGGGDSGKLWPD